MTSPDDAQAIHALRTGEPDALRPLIAAWTPQMKRVARGYVASDAAAEDVVQDAWIVLLGAADRFEGRSSLRTYALGIVVNVAMRVATRERRTLPFSSAWHDDHAPAVPPDRFERGGGWLSPPSVWSARPEELLGAAELRREVERAVESLPVRQRAIFTARDVLRLDAEEVAGMYGVSDSNQRVLLHRSRAKIRAAIEAYVDGTEVAAPKGRKPKAAAAGHPIACRQLVELVDDYLDGRLDPGLRARVEEHLGGCDHCGEYVAQVRRVLSVTSTLVTGLSGEAVDRLLLAIRREHVAG